jgi:hypothetical protein
MRLGDMKISFSQAKNRPLKRPEIPCFVDALKRSQPAAAPTWIGVLL